ncbi:MAG: hypothetical protein FWD57_11470 [Polyangiaceae bacterium]|nr:hypothetical protein [Polyangiaceae bacterium]
MMDMDRVGVKAVNDRRESRESGENRGNATKSTHACDMRLGWRRLLGRSSALAARRSLWLRRQEFRSSCLSHAIHEAAGVPGQTTDNRVLG